MLYEVTELRQPRCELQSLSLMLQDEVPCVNSEPVHDCWGKSKLNC